MKLFFAWLCHAKNTRIPKGLRPLDPASDRSCELSFATRQHINPDRPLDPVQNKVFTLLAILLLGTTLFAESSYVTVVSSNAMIWPIPDAAATPNYYASPGAAYEIVATQNGFIQVVWIGGDMGWISESHVAPYEGAMPPPVGMLGLASPLSSPVIARDVSAAIAVSENSRATENASFSSDQIKAFISDIEADETASSLVAEPTPVLLDVPTPEMLAFERRQQRMSLYKHRISDQDWFRFPPKPMSRYPDLDMDGFVEMKLSGRDYSPKFFEITATDNRWQIIQNDPVYKKLPQNVLVGSPRFDMRLKLGLDGKLSEDVDVHYDIEQEPDFPSKYDIWVRYKNTEMTFYHFDAEFQNGEFINLKKALNGAQVVHKDPFWEGRLAVGQQRSEPKKYASFGSGRNTIQVGVKSLLRDSVKVWVNNAVLQEGKDYRVNYYEGEVTFTTVKSTSDYIEVLYEFTNPIEDFIPVLSRRNFLGAQYLWRAQAEDVRVKKSKKMSERFQIATANLVEENRLALASFPMVFGSETIRLNGHPLRRNTDYTLRQRRGTLQLNFQIKDGDLIEAEYEAYETVSRNETLIGRDTPGPYALLYQDILDDSVDVALNGQPVSEIRDYILDYESGQLYFNYPISYPNVISVSYKAVLSEVFKSSTANVTSPINVGVTYLDEYAKGESEELIQKITSESHTVSNNAVYTKQYPILTDEPFTLLLDGVAAVASTDYVIEDAYRGHISLLKSNVGYAAVSYSFRKSYSTTFVFQAKANRNVYENNTAEFTLRDTPIRYNGVTRVKVSNGLLEEVLVEGQDYAIEYGEDGNVGLKVIFYRRGDVLGAVREDYPAEGSRITLVYDYTPESLPDQGSVSQRQIGITGGINLNKNWRVDAEFSAAGNNFSKPRESSTTTFKGNGQDGYLYDLGKTALVENSEAVYINNVRQTKDQHYSVNYSTGKIRFVNLNPGTSDTVRVEFEYFDSTGQVEAGDEKYSYATKVATTYRDDVVALRADVKAIDKNYVPISPIQERKGTVSLGGAIDLTFDPQTSAGLDYRRREEAQPPAGIKENLYLHTDDLKAYLRYNLAEDLFVRQDLRYYLQYQDPSTDATTGNTHTVDRIAVEQQTSLVSGPEQFRNTFYVAQSRAVDGYIDGFDRNDQSNLKFKWNGNLVFDRLQWLQYLKVQPVYEQSKTSTRITNTTAGTLRDVTDINEMKGIDVVNQPFQNLLLHGFYNMVENTRTEEAAVPTYSRTLNYQYDATYDPFVWIRLGFTHRQKEEQTALVGQSGRLSRDELYRVDNFVPHSFLRYLGGREEAWWVRPWKGSYASYSDTNNRVFENNNRRTNFSNAQRVDLKQLQPLPGLIFDSMSYEKQGSNLLDKVETTSTSENSSVRDYDRKALTMNVKPPLPILDHFQYGLALESRMEKRYQQSLANTGTSNVVQEDLPFAKRDQTLSYQMGQLVLPVFWLFDLNLGGLSASAQDILEDSVNNRYTRQYSSSSENIRQAQDDSYVQTRVYMAKINPFRLFTLDGKYNTQDSRYNRNIDPANTGLTYKEIRDIGVLGNYQPFGFLSLDGKYAHNELTQYRSPTLNLSMQDIQDAEDAGDLTRFRDSLLQKSDTAGLAATFKPLSWFSVTFGGEYGVIRESSKSGTANMLSRRITQKTGTSGIGFYPIPGMDIKYDYSLRFTNQDNTSEQEGYGGKLSFRYLPVKSTNFQVEISYERTDSWGRNLNTLQRKETEQGTGDVIQTEIVETNDTVEYGAVNVNVVIPMPETPYVQNITLTAEGYIKRITDALEDKKVASGQQPISYDITGMFLKMVINF